MCSTALGTPQRGQSRVTRRSARSGDKKHLIVTHTTIEKIAQHRVSLIAIVSKTPPMARNTACVPSRRSARPTKKTAPARQRSPVDGKPQSKLNSISPAHRQRLNPRLNRYVVAMGERDAAQAAVLIRALRELRDQMIDRMTWLEKHDRRSDAAALRRDVNEAQAHITHLHRHYLGRDIQPSQPVRQARYARLN